MKRMFTPTINRDLDLLWLVLPNWKKSKFCSYWWVPGLHSNSNDNQFHLSPDRQNWMSDLEHAQRAEVGWQARTFIRRHIRFQNGALLLMSHLSIDVRAGCTIWVIIVGLCMLGMYGTKLRKFLSWLHGNSTSKIIIQ